MTRSLTRALPALALALAAALSAGGALAQSSGGGGGAGGGSAGGSGTDAWINPAQLIANQSPNGVPGSTIPPVQTKQAEASEICGIQDQSGTRYVYCHQLRRR